jgi:protein-disulfide isomerase
LPTLNKILQDYDGQVRLVYRHFPLNSIHPQAQKAAEASECAGEQGKFWEYHDLLFANQSALQVADLKSYAGKLSLKQSQFDQCLDSGKYANKVNQQAQDAQTSGITGTPGTWVNNQLVKGAYPYETFKQIIDALLK